MRLNEAYRHPHGGRDGHFGDRRPAGLPVHLLHLEGLATRGKIRGPGETREVEMGRAIQGYPVCQVIMHGRY